MVDETPAQTESMEDAKSVKVDLTGVEVLSSANIPVVAKAAHLLALFIAGVIALCVACVLADGTSVIKLKDAKYLPVATNPALKSAGLSYRLDQLLGPTYGVGLHHDQAGYSWTETGAQDTLANLLKNLGTPAVIAAVPSVISTDGLKHPVPFLSCDDLQKAGLAAMSLGFIAEAVAVVMVLFHALILVGCVPAKIGKPLAALVWLVLTAGFLIVVLIATGVYTATWTCGQPVIPSIVLSDHFEYSYGFPFAILGFVSSLLIFVTQLFLTSTKDGESQQPVPSVAKAIVKVLAGIVAGATVCAAVSVVILGANGSFNAKPGPDPNVNPCEGKKPYHAGPGDNYFDNVNCFKDSVTQTLEQAGANVTKGYKGLLDAGNRVPITTTYKEAGLCPVNVHWHLGAEHLSVGQFDAHGTGPAKHEEHAAGGKGRELAAGKEIRRGHRCHYYDESNPAYTTPYAWKHCTDMYVGETYEIHWPHSAAGACGTEWAMQTPFYDGVFCNDGIITIAPLNTYSKIGVQSQVFTIVNDEAFYYGDLIKGMIVSDAVGSYGVDMAMYTGSTTGTSRDNKVCSRYTPITWQVDRKCHKISASSFDKLCHDMMLQKDDMSGDVYPHGAREVVADSLTANNQYDSRRK